MFEVMTKEAHSCDIKELIAKFSTEVIGKSIEKQTQNIFPLQNVFVRKVKVLKAPKFDLGKLIELHGDSMEDTGAKVNTGSVKEFVEPEIQMSV